MIGTEPGTVRQPCQSCGTSVQPCPNCDGREWVDLSISQISWDALLDELAYSQAAKSADPLLTLHIDAIDREMARRGPQGMSYTYLEHEIIRLHAYYDDYPTDMSVEYERDYIRLLEQERSRRIHEMIFPILHERNIGYQCSVAETEHILKLATKVAQVRIAAGQSQPEQYTQYGPFLLESAEVLRQKIQDEKEEAQEAWATFRNNPCKETWVEYLAEAADVAYQFIKFGYIFGDSPKVFWWTSVYYDVNTALFLKILEVKYDLRAQGIKDKQREAAAIADLLSE